MSSADRAEWTVERIGEAMKGPGVVQMNLLHPIPVLILYATAVVEETGEVRFFDDVYGLDSTLERALARPRPYATDRGGRKTAQAASPQGEARGP